MSKGEPNPGLDRVHHELRGTGVRDGRLNRLRSGIHSRGYLPHVKREGAAYFVTFRLADSLPRQLLLQLERRHAERVRSLKPGNIEALHETNRERLRDIERALDRGVGVCHLRRPDIAKLVAESLLHFHGVQYLLDDWVIMPNHVHLILWPMPNHTLSAILASRKRHIARQANLILGRTGTPFWQRESFDHWIRSDDEKARIRRYIGNNPVKAGLCGTPTEWKWGSAWPGWQTKERAVGGNASAPVPNSS
jgi:REP element-mobilizing transposase RayT